MVNTNRRLRLLLGAAAISMAAVLLAAPSSSAQQGCGFLGMEPCPTTTTTTTTEPPRSTTTTAPPDSTDDPPESTTTTQPPSDDGSSTTAPPPADGSTPSPPPPGGTDDPDAQNPDGDGDVQPGVIPPDAQAIINSVVRSGPNSSADLLAAIEPLVDMGLSRDEAIRISFGAFPIAGEASFIHDWLFPRYGPGLRFHQGTDLFAAFGTPLRAVTDGTLRASDGGLGGLSVRVVQPDGVYFYYTHLSALVDGYQEGMAVQTGDIIGYVGDSGNARGGSPHLHFGIYRGGTAIDPKPFLDQALADAMENLPNVIEQVRVSIADGGFTPDSGTRRPRSLLATSLLRDRGALTAAGVVNTETLYQTSGNPSAGGVAVVENEAGRLAAVIDWSTRLLEGPSGAG